MAIRQGLIAREQAYRRYALSPEELASWEDAFDSGGLRAFSTKGMLRARKTRSKTATPRATED
jgi:hypothetical protein